MVKADTLLFDMLKGGVDKRSRDAMGASMARTLSQDLRFPLPVPTSIEQDILHQLTQRGFAAAPQLFSAAELDEIDAYFADKPLAFGDNEVGTKTVSGFPADRPPALRFGNWSQDVISGCPPFCRVAHDPTLLRIAQAYLEAPPTVTILTAWWSFPSTAARGGMQNFHHDRDDFRILKVFSYLTDTTEASGPHEFVDGTHTFDTLLNFMRGRTWLSAQQQVDFLRWMEEHRKSDADVRKFFPRENIRTITGPRGTTFFEDTRGLHRGLPPASVPRLAFEICYTLLPKLSADYAPVRRPCVPVQLDKTAAYATRLFYK